MILSSIQVLGPKPQEVPLIPDFASASPLNFAFKVHLRPNLWLPLHPNSRQTTIASLLIRTIVPPSLLPYPLFLGYCVQTVLCLCSSQDDFFWNIFQILSLFCLKLFKVCPWHLDQDPGLNGPALPSALLTQPLEPSFCSSVLTGFLLPWLLLP